jgi:hypothetical protein
MRRVHLREHGQLIANALSNVANICAPLDWGDLTAPLTDASEFVRPFTSFDAQTFDPGSFRRPR